MRLLNTRQSDYFFHLHRHLILFTNQKYKICNIFKSVSDLENLDLYDDEISSYIMTIRQKMYTHDNIQDFSHTNPYKFTQNELSDVGLWSNYLSLQAYVISHLSSYTVIMSENNVLYGIKSLKSDLAEMIPSQVLPVMINVIILPFEGDIIYDGFLSQLNISFGSGIKGSIKEEYNSIKALKGIYSNYEIGDDLSNPPATNTIEDTLKYSISQSLKQGEFPQKALELSKSKNSRNIFEKLYTKHYLKNVKKNLKANNDIPKMYYAAYRESIIGVMPTKKTLDAFCQNHYKDIFEYITIFSV